MKQIETLHHIEIVKYLRILQSQKKIITFFAAIVPAAVALYWVTSNIFMIIQEYWINKQLQQKTTI